MPNISMILKSAYKIALNFELRSGNIGITIP